VVTLGRGLCMTRGRELGRRFLGTARRGFTRARGRGFGVRAVGSRQLGLERAVGVACWHRVGSSASRRVAPGLHGLGRRGGCRGAGSWLGVQGRRLAGRVARRGLARGLLGVEEREGKGKEREATDEGEKERQRLPEQGAAPEARSGGCLGLGILGP
jgi:hypothetical protein